MELVNLKNILSIIQKYGLPYFKSVVNVKIQPKVSVSYQGGAMENNP